LSVLDGRQHSSSYFGTGSPIPARGLFIHPGKYLLHAIFLPIILFWSCSRQIHQPPPTTGNETEPDIRACLGENFSRATLSFEGEYRLRSEEALYYFDKSIGELTISVERDRLTLSNNVRFFRFSHDVLLRFQSKEPSASFVWNGTAYSGDLEIQFKSNYVCAINVLPVETYLRGVVPFEIPTGQEEYREAVYAQTIAARTYSLYRLEHPSGQSFDVYSDVRDQVYNGLKRTTDLADEAIEKTVGIVLLDKGEPAFAQYHSTCGGVLQDTLTSVRRDLVKTEFNCSLSPLFRWVEIRSGETILSNLVREYKIEESEKEKLLNSGLQLELAVEGRNSDGRVTSIETDIPGRKLTAEGYRIRRVLADENGTPLPSNLFLILKPPQDPDRFYVIGAGYGHGRGMCQWGALGMSLEGYSYVRILSFYYPSFNLKTIYSKQRWLF
jgi:stage II sporulation protein D (peptidoglycan lytic transglycosylase)